MKVTFLIPPVLDRTHDVDRCFGCNYGIYFLPLLPALYSATILKNDGVDVSIKDFAAMKMPRSGFEAFIQKDDSDIYVFYTVFLCQETDLIAQKMMRSARKGIKLIFCGPQPTFAAEVFLTGDDSFAVRGEPEFIIRDLVRALKNGSDISAINGVSYRRGDAVVHNPPVPPIWDLDTLPIPDRTLLDHRPYFNPKLPAVPHTAILTSRGCYGQCWFCVPNSLSYARELEYKKVHGRKPPPRMHSAERVIVEFTDIARLGFKSVSIIDDQFLLDEERILRICEGIKGLGIQWSCLARSDKITDPLAKSMKEAGCVYVDLGTESFDEKVLHSIRKDMLPSDTDKAVDILRRNGLEVEINIILGASPEETEDTIRNTLKRVKELDVDYVLFSIANPFPGTDFYEAAKKGGWMYYGDYVPVDSAKNSIISYPHLSKKKLESLIAYAYLSYYFRPRYLLKRIMHLKGPHDLVNKFTTMMRFLVKNFLKKDKHDKEHP